MLEFCPNCECCDRDLSPSGTDVMICSVECTFCQGCAETVLGGRLSQLPGEPFSAADPGWRCADLQSREDGPDRTFTELCSTQSMGPFGLLEGDCEDEPLL